MPFRNYGINDNNIAKPPRHNFLFIFHFFSPPPSAQSPTPLIQIIYLSILAYIIIPSIHCYLQRCYGGYSNRLNISQSNLTANMTDLYCVLSLSRHCEGKAFWHISFALFSNRLFEVTPSLNFNTFNNS